MGTGNGALKITRGAAVTSFLRYSMTITGSRRVPDLMKRSNTQSVNVATRNAGGLSRSARIESMHFLLGTHTIYNLYETRCAEFSDSCLRNREELHRGAAPTGVEEFDVEF